VKNSDGINRLRNNSAEHGAQKNDGYICKASHGLILQKSETIRSGTACRISARTAPAAGARKQPVEAVSEVRGVGRREVRVWNWGTKRRPDQSVRAPFRCLLQASACRW